METETENERVLHKYMNYICTAQTLTTDGCKLILQIISIFLLDTLLRIRKPLNLMSQSH
ncbi:hypothetical protein DAI22_05g062600 [Oryza sativa Japonica Group]|nr:hypothetical protein DAI22_05g062600 [Oryza sativa Japonica Group]